MSRHRKQQPTNNRETVARFLVSIAEGMGDEERAAFYRDLLMDYCFFDGNQLNKDRQVILERIAADYGRAAPVLGKDSGQDLLGVLQKKTTNKSFVGFRDL